jgi:predicted enzyme related to lactoylglutathione lyase
MSEREGFIPGVPCWIQGVHPDPAAAVSFYTELFGWEAENLMAADHPGDYFVCRLRGRDVAAIVSHHGAPTPPSAVWSTCVCADSADAAVANVEAAGGSVIGQPFDSPGGGRLGVVADPAVAVFSVWEPRSRIGAQLVNEPSAWAMSALTTSEPEEARRFYGEVFGWETEAFDLAGAEMTLWRLPGYVGGKPQQPVPRDVVATMFPMAAGGGEAAPSWTVDFWIANLDDALATATDHGATVVSRPVHIPGTDLRQAAIADPQGAPLSLTRPPGLS